MKSHFTVNIFFVLLWILLLFGCEPSKYIDVSDQKEFEKIIGAEYITLDDLKVIGVTFDANYKKVVDYVYLVEKPGFSGPEVVFSEILGKGARLKVDGVFASDSILANRVYYKVTIVDTEEYQGDIVLIYYTGDIDNQDMGMNEVIFKRLNGTD